MLFTAIVLALLTGNALCRQQVFSQPPTVCSAKQVITPELSALVERLMEDANVPGMTLGVVHSGGNVEFGAFGRKTEDDDKMTADTLFDIASCSKAFLAASVGILIDDFALGINETVLPVSVQKFDWHTKLVDLLPDDWKLMDDWASEKATLRDVLSHQSGLPRHEFSYRPTDKPIDVIRKMRYLRPAFELRQRWHYNNLFYMAGAHIISTYSGKPYTEFIKERIWDRLNMSSTTFSASEAARSGKLAQTWTGSGRRIPFWFPDEMIELNAGPGGIISSAVDLTRWLQVLLNEGVDPVTNRSIIPRAVYEDVTMAHSIVSPRSSQSWFSTESYGMGWFIRSYQGQNIWTHAGSIPGFSAEVFFLPDSGLGIVTLSNGDSKHQQELAVCYRIIEDFLDLERNESERLITKALPRTPHAETGFAQAVNDAKAPSTLSLPLEDYAGTYYDPGYGNLTLCAPTLYPSSECADVLKEWSFFEDTADATRQVLYAAISSTWISHLRLTHLAGDKFGLSGNYLFPNGYGKDKSPFLLDEEADAAATAEFWTKSTGGADRSVVGVAVNGFVGERTERQRIGGSIEETAEVWLIKV